MKTFSIALVFLAGLVVSSCALQIPLQDEDVTSPQIAWSYASKNTVEAEALISNRTGKYIHNVMAKWNVSGMSVAVVRKDPLAPNGWRYEFGGYGIADANGSPMTADSVFAVASNSKLFLAISVGLLISNKTLADERGEKIEWSTKVANLIPEWGLMDDGMSRGVTLQDMLSHRTGMPRHDFSGFHRKGGVPEMVR